MSKNKVLLLAIVAAVAIAGIWVASMAVSPKPAGPYNSSTNVAQNPQNHVINVTDSVSVGDKR